MLVACHLAYKCIPLPRAFRMAMPPRIISTLPFLTPVILIQLLMYIQCLAMPQNSIIQLPQLHHRLRLRLKLRHRHRHRLGLRLRLKLRLKPTRMLQHRISVDCIPTCQDKYLSS